MRNSQRLTQPKLVRYKFMLIEYYATSIAYLDYILRTIRRCQCRYVLALSVAYFENRPGSKALIGILVWPLVIRFAVICPIAGPSTIPCLPAPVAI